MITIKQEILAVMDQKITKQNEKGMNTYGQPLEDCKEDAYDWADMALEESVDMNQYLIKENRRLKRLLSQYE